MRSHRSRDTERESAASPTSAPRRAERGVPPAGLLGLQRAVGNDAVVHLLRRAGHPGAQEEDEAPVQRSEVRSVLSGNGRPLDATTRSDMEGRLGADFADVRLHTGSQARRSAAEIGARAYTSGTHVVLGDGGGDRHTLAHELTHVIQQRKGPVAGTDNGAGLSISDPGDRFEREAEANARRALRGPAPAHDGHAGHGAHEHGEASGGDGAAAVQRVKRNREESAEGDISDAVNYIAEPSGWGPYKEEDGGGRGLEIPKSDEGIACWEWAVRAAEQSGGLDRGQYWDYLIGMRESGNVEEIDQLEPAVRSDLDGLRDRIAAAGMAFDLTDIDKKHDQATVDGFVEEGVRTFVQAHGLEITDDDPAGWIICQYTTDGTVAVPEHFWIELPVPNKPGSRVLLQTVPGKKHIEAGPQNLRWHDEMSIPERSSNAENYRKVVVPVAALKGRHTQIINSIMERGRRTRRK